MTEITDRVSAALREHFGEFTSPAKLEAASRSVAAAVEAEIADLREDAEDARRERGRFFDAVVWALGMASEGFAERQEGHGAYWWRSELRRRAWPDGVPFAVQHWKDRAAGHAEPDWARDSQLPDTSGR